MTVAKTIELHAESTMSWEEAVKDAVAEASKSLTDIKHVYASEFQALVEDGEIVRYRVNCKVTFVVKHDD